MYWCDDDEDFLMIILMYIHEFISFTTMTMVNKNTTLTRLKENPINSNVKSNFPMAFMINFFL